MIVSHCDLGGTDSQRFDPATHRVLQSGSDLQTHSALHTAQSHPTTQHTFIMDIEKLQVQDLKRELDARGEDARGTKAVLKERLIQVMKEESFQKKAEQLPKEESEQKKDIEQKKDNEQKKDIEQKRDVEQQKDVETRTQDDMIDARSIRSTSSRGSVTSQGAAEAARRAGLKAKMDALKQKHEIEVQIENLHRKQEEVQLLADLKECEAKDSVLAQFEANETKQKGPVCERRETVVKSADNASEQVNLITSDRFVMRRIGLQPLELRAFDGTEEDFLPFMTAFESNIACRLEKEEEKLMYLLQLTKGMPHDIVATCVYMSEGGYSEAVRLLKVRYGSCIKSRASVIEKVQKHACIRYEDVKGFEGYTVFLRGSLNALQSPAVGDSGFHSWIIC